MTIDLDEPRVRWFRDGDLCLTFESKGQFGETWVMEHCESAWHLRIVVTDNSATLEITPIEDGPDGLPVIWVDPKTLLDSEPFSPEFDAHVEKLRQRWLASR